MKSAAEGSHLVVFPMQKSAPDESGQWKFSASNAQRLHVMTRAEVVEQLTKVKTDIELQPLSSINQIFDRLEHGDVASRVVLEFTKC